MAHSSIRTKYRDKSIPVLSWTSAMQAWSFSLPAGKEGSCPMATTDENSICCSCYAMTGRYCSNFVLDLQFLRLSWVKAALAADSQNWIRFMIFSIRSQVKNGYFRIHDSGDFFSLDYLKAWISICSNLPEIKFWCPTRAWVFPNWMKSLRILNKLNNVVVRPSALYFDDKAPNIAGLAAGSTAIYKNDNYNDSTVCPKSIKHTSCETEHCRDCWDKIRRPIAYLMHGYKITLKIKNKRLQTANRLMLLTINGR